MKRKIFLFLAACYAAAMSAGTVNYTADNTTIFPNPERGFITMVEGKQKTKYYAVKGSSLDTKIATDKLSLILVLYYLEEFKNTETLPDSVLNAFNEDMSILRSKGLKAILRFAYTADGYKYEKTPGKKDSVRSAHDAPLEIIEKHLAQYKSHWAANTDVIFCFQAGFIGQYGEWYYTDNFDNTSSHMTSKRKQFMDTLLNATPQNRTILLRTPLFKTDYMDSIYGSHAALTADDAYSGSAKARLGQHNDAFLNGLLNQGTYRDAARTEEQKTYISQETLYVPIGGECNITHQDSATKYANHDATVAEMSRLHWTFIQSGYAETTTNMWRNNDGTFDELNRNMGYRYQLVEGTYGEAVTLGNEATNKLSVSLQIKNVGYAPLYNERPAYIVLKNENATYALLLPKVDPRTWKPSNNAYTIDKTLTVPDTVYNGTYDLYLWLPDAYESLQNDARYSIRLANTDVWEETSGMNNLNAQVVVTGGEDAPEPVDTSIHLPATLNKDNYTTVSEDAWWSTNNEYFDFESNVSNNTNRWIEWQVRLVTPGKYKVSEVGYCTNGHSYLLQLKNGNSLVSDFTAYDTDHYGGGEQNYTQKNKWDLCNVSAGIYTLRVSNSTKYGKPKLKSITLDLFGTVSSDTITLPNTLTKANVADYTNNIDWYGADNEYFDFKQTASNPTLSWVDWRVYVYPVQYTITEVGYYPNGHNYSLSLVNQNGDTISSYTTTKTYTTGELTITQTAKWDLSGVAAGYYTLRASNALQDGTPKLKSLTLEYDGDIPSSIDETTEAAADGQQYDILGRPVDDSYRGIVIMKGRKILR